MIWKKISLLCVFGFLKEFQPSAPFAIEYLTGPWKNFTREQIYQEVLPISGYSQLATLLPVLLLTDVLRYKSIIILSGLSLSCAQIILLFARSLWALKGFKMFIGLFYSTEVAYYSYIFAKVSEEHYQEATSHAVTAILLGKFVASVTGQFCISYGLLDYHQLNYLTILGSVFGTIWAFFLPPVSRIMYLNRKTVCDISETLQPQIESRVIKLKRSAEQIYYPEPAVNSVNDNKSPPLISNIKVACHILWKDFLFSYSQTYVLKWSAWWAFSFAAYIQVMVYVQVLWQTSFTEVNIVHNGAVEASQTMLSALATFGVGKLKLNWPVIGDAMLTVSTMISGILLLVAAETYNVWLSYAVYIGFSFLSQAFITIASCEIAKNLPVNSYGLIFGLNTVAALILQAIMTFTVTESWGFALTIRPQFVVYGSYYIALGTVFMVITIYTTVKQCKSDERFYLWQSADVTSS